ncbi:MAG: ABC transporter permease [Thermoanaerobaculia bacterium]
MSTAARNERPPARGLRLALLGMAAIGQRAFLTLWRQPVLVVSTMIFPIVYLLILGNAMNRPLEHVPLAVVDEAGNAYAAECRRGVLALESGRQLVDASFLSDRGAALDGLRRGRYRGVWVLPFGLSPAGPAPSFIGDNTDRFSFEALESALRQIWQEVSAPRDTPPVAAAVRLEGYPYLDYLTYLGPAIVCLAIFMGSMVSGGLQVLEDRMYGYHEGYLVTPISTGTLVAGNILAGAIVASIAGGLVLACIVFLSPLPPAGGASLAAAGVTVFLTSLSIAALWFLVFARARSTSLLRGMFGIINVLVFFPSGALYPIESYPGWLAKLSAMDPMTYGVRSLRNLLLRGAAPASSIADWVFLLTFTLVCGVLTKVLFRREV